MMTNADDERKAAEKALAVIRSLTPTTQHMDAIIFPLRYAARLATDAAREGLHLVFLLDHACAAIGSATKFPRLSDFRYRVKVGLGVMSGLYPPLVGAPCADRQCRGATCVGSSDNGSDERPLAILWRW
jgi:hypothetical protein